MFAPLVRGRSPRYLGCTGSVTSTNAAASVRPMIAMSCPVTGSVQPQLPLRLTPRFPPTAEIGMYESKLVLPHSKSPVLPSTHFTSLPVTEAKRSTTGGITRLFSVQPLGEDFARNATVPPP